ncbi:MAG: UDP-N-acetylglucosamine 4,6-dehydratase (inverting) [Candidatus Komeilibacteria bacterium]|nr:UDP-N-acetylglucosamine 4,6-dehydratase (inverting) [Candidatus Komeilibacteria bacterium]
MLEQKTVLITGGTGSFGSNFARYLLANYNLKKLIIFSRDERKQFDLQKELQDKRVRFFLGDVRDLPRLQRAFKGVDIVIHAAALKHIPILEYNPFEAVQTNILGSQNVINAAIDQGVAKVLLISTDKAAHPVNLYGSTKLCAEKLFINGNFYASDATRLACVRYGNVIGSRGSIVETLLNKAHAEQVCITHEGMTRFWISLEQAFNLVLFALENMDGGEIFIPKIPSMKLVDLFEALAPGVERTVSGIRPGEKLHEVLLTKEEARRAYEVDKYFVILPEFENKDIQLENRFEKYVKNGTKLHDEFYYSSDSNTHWFTIEDFRKMYKK